MNMSFCLGVLSWLSFQISEVPIVTDRPDFTESSVVVPKGSVQLESGFTFVRASKTSKSLSGPELLFRQGLTERLELRLGLPSFSRITNSGPSHIDGFGDTYVGAKLQLGPSKDGTEFAIIPAVVIPTGHDDIRSENLAPEIKFVYSRSLSNGCALSGMVYVSSVKEGGRNTTPVQHTVSLGVPIREKVGMFVEHVLDVSRRERPSHLLHCGFTYQPKLKTQFDVHFGIGLTPGAPNYFVAGGYSIRF